MEPVIAYTELWVRDGDANNAGGKVVQYWVAINRVKNTKVSITTYNGDIKGAPINEHPLTTALETKIKKQYTQINGDTRVPAVFHKVGSENMTPDIKHDENVVPEPENIPVPEKLTITLAHPAVKNLSFDDIEELTSLDKLNTFIARIANVANRRHPSDEKACDKLKGDIFEIFVEFLLKSKGTDAHTGITHYQVADQTTDLGIDGYGISIKNSKPATVQVKYRQYNHILVSNEDKLSNFLGQSLLHFGKQGFFPSDKANMLIVTSAKEVHFSVDEIFDGKCRYLCNEQLRSMTDGLEEFWVMFRDAMLDGRSPNPSKAPKGKPLRDHQKEAVNEVMANIA